MTTLAETEDDEWAEYRRAAREASRRGDLLAAIEPMRAALALRPKDRDTISGAAAILNDMGLSARAERALRMILAEYPDDHLSQHRLADALLKQGRYREAWPHWDHRPARQLDRTYVNKLPEWRGEPLEGRSILVVGEQGLGDEIQFARFIPALRKLGPARITVGCNPLNMRVFQQLGVDAVFDRLSATTIRRHDYCVLIGSLPRWLNIGFEDISGAPYLSAEPVGSGGIGLVSRGSPTHSNDCVRSLPQGLLAEAIPEGRELTPSGDVLDSLSALGALDLLITVDTSWAHMAGALGVPVWILLPRHFCDWRWLRDRSDSPWYASARLFRQEHPGDWASVLAQVRQALDDSSSVHAVT